MYLPNAETVSEAKKKIVFANFQDKIWNWKSTFFQVTV